MQNYESNYGMGIPAYARVDDSDRRIQLTSSAPLFYTPTKSPFDRKVEAFAASTMVQQIATLRGILADVLTARELKRHLKSFVRSATFTVATAVEFVKHVWGGEDFDPKFLKAHPNQQVRDAAVSHERALHDQAKKYRRQNLLGGRRRTIADFEQGNTFMPTGNRGADVARHMKRKVSHDLRKGTKLSPNGKGSVRLTTVDIVLIHGTAALSCMSADTYNAAVVQMRKIGLRPVSDFGESLGMLSEFFGRRAA